MSTKKASVIVKRLQTPHQTESFRQFQPLSPEMKAEVFSTVAELFDEAGGKALLKSSRNGYLKPNAVDSKPYSYTRPEFIEAVIRYWKEVGANRIYLFENCTSSNFTRMVFSLTGYSDICKRYGVREVYLEEGKTIPFTFRGRATADREEGGYVNTTFHLSKFIKENLIDGAGENFYINLPKLKTHSMAGVTLGVKNQWAFPQHNDRRADHNFNLANKLADVMSYIQPDYTMIEGVEAVIHGNYPTMAFADKCILPFRLLIGSTNVTAADLVGARLFGLTPEDAHHLKVAIERGYSRGVKSLDDVEIIGDISDFVKRYEYGLYPQYPEDIVILKGKERCCIEGCQNNPLNSLQSLAYDFGGKGGWTMVMGKGHDPAVINALEGRVLVVGHCAIEEVGNRLISRLGRKNVYLSGYCNDLCSTVTALCHLMKVNPLAMAPQPFFTAIKLLFLSKIHGSKANVPFFFAHKIKRV
jgi:uncharacterized protein (DUF362 family)